ncbi:hypothetical protein DL96DRAFT_1459079 [Flagelloscypha sp. PMI_526]|nr:hypothetical protein DL96DRAFT_1459079 [Flagelloscypha sp. PMI_526]
MSLTSTQTKATRPLQSKRVGLNVLDYSSRHLSGVHGTLGPLPSFSSDSSPATTNPGAKQVIADICKRRTFSKLLLSHNPLGPEGHELLFTFLATKGSRFKIAELHLNDTGMGMRGLAALSSYIDGNQSLKELSIQGNVLASEPECVVTSFIDALGTCSSLAKLHLSTNPDLGDAFFKLFFARIRSPSLTELHLALVGLSPECAPEICSFLSSPERSKSLKTLSLSANSIGLAGTEQILEAIEKKNWWLEGVQFFGNNLGPGWKGLEPRAQKVFFRNERLRRSTEADALRLLHHARPLLLQPSSSSVSVSKTRPNKKPLLPAELIFHVLSFLSSYLTEDQLIRVHHYASDPQTLPRVVPLSLPQSHDCVPDPTALLNIPDGSSSSSSNAKGELWPTISSSPKRGCGDCENYLVCHREKERQKFLQRVHCIGFELS